MTSGRLNVGNENNDTDLMTMKVTKMTTMTNQPKFNLLLEFSIASTMVDLWPLLAIYSGARLKVDSKGTKNIVY